MGDLMSDPVSLRSNRERKSLHPTLLQILLPFLSLPVCPRPDTQLTPRHTPATLTPHVPTTQVLSSLMSPRLSITPNSLQL